MQMSKDSKEKETDGARPQSGVGREDVLVLLWTAGVIVVRVAVAIVVIWLLISGVRWFWQHPLW